MDQTSEKLANSTPRSLVSSASWVTRAHLVIGGLLGDGTALRKSQVARQLGTSERTLQRRLSEHGTSFQAVHDDVRRELAESLLSTTTTTLCEVAHLLGFSDQSAFQRAFRSWTGQTPNAFRVATSAPPQPVFTSANYTN